MKQKNQTATEYLIILAVVIIIALIVVGALGLIPGLGQNVDVDDLADRTAEIGLQDINVFQTHAEFTVVNNDNILPIRVTSITFNDVQDITLLDESTSLTGLIAPGSKGRFLVKINGTIGSFWGDETISASLNLTVFKDEATYNIDKIIDNIKVGCVPDPEYCLVHDLNADSNVSVFDVNYIMLAQGADEAYLDFDCSGEVDGNDVTVHATHLACHLE